MSAMVVDVRNALNGELTSVEKDRIKISEAFKKAMTRELPLDEKASTAIFDGIGKDVKVEKLGSEENAFLENAVRSLLDELVRLALKEGVPVMQYGKGIGNGDTNKGFVPRLLDIVLLLCRDAHVEAGLIFTLLLDLTEASTIEDCNDVFSYIESQQEVLGKTELHTRGKLVMLRTCNQLLRRLSKANDNVFCGRIIMFLAHFFPLSERSGTDLDAKFYKMFWGLQNYFRNPPSALVASTFQAFSRDLQAVLSVFESQRLTGDDEAADDALVDGDDLTYNTKYLTSTKLMSLQIRDPNFRRHFLVQCLILFDYLASPAKVEKDHLREDQVWWKRDNCMPFEKPATEKLPPATSQRRRTRRNLLGNPELSRLWQWAQANPDVLVDRDRVKVPSILEYWKPLADDMDPSAGIEEEYHHKKNKVYCWRGLRLNARQELDLFAKVTEQGIEGAVPAQLLPEKKRQQTAGKQTSPTVKQARVEKKDEQAERPPATQAQPNTDDAAMVEGTAAEAEEDSTAMDAEPAAAENAERENTTAEDGAASTTTQKSAGGREDASAAASDKKTDANAPLVSLTTAAAKPAT
ncbi:hypothetical protein CBR_g45491 [Chara braunii]|uniref:THO complex subunit 1 n=1 Tax=Chara braunii TaxID=69332 RepID=A0A388LYV1_CHABU|nr:hypothetical protein CBR_g45491 [Chara braunii]|eukprot:GBG87433.1 hypothetical protein CBR_g45491 [Chara braunii]